ncbi:NUDIX domain-containing protein [Arboricoccus pini]|uniref:NUDIX domain-containing protein n=1 Tax=Arboricoccus pini TaxID=1963835 RepID=UPI001A9C8427|nr:NUDIX domain-containing protein [Arboricoccus pini]
MSDKPLRPSRFEIIARQRAYQGFFALDVVDLRHEQFDGSWSQPIRRELFCISNAVGILPYDSRRNRVVLIEQFRTGPLGAVRDATTAQPWMIETPAGLIETGEDPEMAGRRELVEECGLTADRMELIHQFYPSPGASAERVNLFVAEVDLPVIGQSVHGLASEHEDILNHVLELEEALSWLDDGRIQGVTAVMALLWMKSSSAALQERWRAGRD